MPGYAAAVDDAAISAEALTSWSATLVEHLGTPVDIADALDEPGTFSKRTEHEIVLLVDARTVPGSPGHVLAPGEAEAECLAEVRGVILDLEHLENLCSLAERHDVPLPETGSFQTLQCYVTKRCTTSMSLDSQSLDEHGCRPRVQATGAGHGCKPRVQATGASMARVRARAVRGRDAGSPPVSTSLHRAAPWGDAYALRLLS